MIFILIVFIAGTAGSSAQGTWNPKPDFVTLRCLMSAFTIGNYGYIGTGISSPNPVQVTCKDLWQYNPVTSIWTQMANLPAISRRRPVGFAVNGK
ncbi:MAG TPA: kelch repeat-containing protein [Bacteroidia bacterium]